MKNRDIQTGFRHWWPGITALLLLATLSGGLWAQSPGTGYEMTFISSHAQGDLIAQGRYRLAVHLLASLSPDPVATMINRCVARTMIGEFSKARRDCNRAVELSEQAARGNRPDDYRNWAIALSNRGVMRAIRGQEGAEDDFRQAIRLQVYSDIATRNLARFEDRASADLAAY